MKWALSILGSILASILKIWANKTDPATVEAKRQAEQRKIADAAIEAARRADQDAVNEFLRRNLAVAWALVCIWFLCSCTTTRVVYAAEADRVVYQERAGVPGWWVPQPVFERMIEKITAASKGEE